MVPRISVSSSTTGVRRPAALQCFSRKRRPGADWWAAAVAGPGEQYSELLAVPARGKVSRGANGLSELETLFRLIRYQQVI